MHRNSWENRTENFPWRCKRIVVCMTTECSRALKYSLGDGKITAQSPSVLMHSDFNRRKSWHGIRGKTKRKSQYSSHMRLHATIQTWGLCTGWIRIFHSIALVFVMVVVVVGLGWGEYVYWKKREERLARCLGQLAIPQEKKKKLLYNHRS